MHVYSCNWETDLQATYHGLFAYYTKWICQLASPHMFKGTHKQTAGEAVKTYTTRLSDHQLGRTDWQVSASGSSQSAVPAALHATEVRDCF